MDPVYEEMKASALAMIMETPDEMKGRDHILVGPSGGHVDLKEITKKMQF